VGVQYRACFLERGAHARDRVGVEYGPANIFSYRHSMPPLPEAEDKTAGQALKDRGTLMHVKA